MVMFKSLVSDTTQATTQATQGNDNSITSRILKVIRKNPMMSQKEIAETIGENPNTAKYHMRSMKNSGVIKREGSSQKGKWIVL